MLSIMKKYIIIAFALLIATSCSDFLEEESKGQLMSDSFYKNAEELDMAVTGLYRSLAESTSSDACTSPTLGGQDMTSEFDGFQEFDVFNAAGDNVQTAGYWALMYRIIAVANELINNYEQAEDATETERNQAAGQAYFARAYAYFTLVRIWNGIPLYTKNEDATDDIAKSSPEDVYELIISDLKLAESMLPSVWTDKKANIGITSGAAKTLLAYAYLTMAGYPVNDESAYALAASKAKEVIDDEDEYGYKLLDNFADLFLFENNINDEIVFATFHNRSNRKSSRCPRGGKPTEYGGWDCYFAEINFFKDFPEGARKNGTFMSTFPMKDGTTVDWTGTIQQHPYYTKYWDDGDAAYSLETPWEDASWKSSRTNIVFRYSNVLLIYAEAQAMSSSADALAYQAINRVRTRAGLPDLSSGLSQTAFRDSVVQERAWEFAGAEFAMAPWYDLVRLERVEEAAADRDESELELSTITKDDYFAPYPTVDVLINEGLDD